MAENKQQTIQREKEQWEKLSDRVRALLIGLALGDGSVKVNKGYKNARMQFRHSINQTEYFMWKRDILRAEVSVDKTSHAGNKDTTLQEKTGDKEYGTQKWRYCSQAHEALTYLNRLTYEGSSRVIRRSTLNMMTPLSLAVMWLDNGSLVANGRQGVICTDAYTEEEVKILGQYIKVVWGIETTAYIVKEEGKPKLKKDGAERWRLRISTREDLEKWLKLIMPHVEVKAMIKKIMLRWPDAERQQRWISEIAELTKFTREEVEEEWRTVSKKAENDIVHSESESKAVKGKDWEKRE